MQKDLARLLFCMREAFRVFSVEGWDKSGGNISPQMREMIRSQKKR